MNDDLLKRMKQMSRMASDGILGDDAKKAHKEYSKIPEGYFTFIKVISDFYSKKIKEDDKELFQLADLFCQLIIVLYRESKKNDIDVANSIVSSIISDFPGVNDSCLYPSWESLVKAAVAFKSCSKTNPLLIWQQATKLVQSYNEFLNGLLGYFIIGWRCALGKSYSSNIFNNAYGAKLNEFKELTNGEDGPFYIFFRLGNPQLRNAIAHETIWYDEDLQLVKYKDIKKDETHELGIIDFIGLAAASSHLPESFLVAIASIVVLEHGNAITKNFIPKHICNVFFHNT